MPFLILLQLKKVTLPQNIDYIGCGAFSGCRALEEVKFAEGPCRLLKRMRCIQPRTFEECKSLKEICFPRSVGAVGTHAFSGCSALRKVVFGDGSNVDVSLPISKRERFYIDFEAFEDCKSLTPENFIVNDVVNIHIYTDAFEGCSPEFTLSEKYKSFPGRVLKAMPEIKVSWHYTLPLWY